MKRTDTAKSDETPRPDQRVDGSTVEGKVVGCDSFPACRGVTDDVAKCLMEEVVSRGNMLKAYARVKANQGGPGVDGMHVDALLGYCGEHWSCIKEGLLTGHYRPQAVKRVMIPKPGGGERALGIPTVVDRLIQQALLQVLQPHYDGHFSDGSYGFRPGRSALGAVKQAQAYVNAGHRWVVDIDLATFFDEVNHDVLMSRLARRIKDKRVLVIIRRYLQAGALEGGVVSTRQQGTPQGGPLSPLLSNILLDEWDKALEKRGHRFVRYADDCNIYVRSKAAGERVMSSMKRFLWTRLRLRVNETKSQVCRPWETQFLGYGMTRHRVVKLKPSPKSVKRLKQKLREMFRRGRGQSLGKAIKSLAPRLRGWFNYFRLSEVKGVFDTLDQWLRRRLRVLLWRRWKRAATRVRMLIRRGLSQDRARQSAYNHRGAWWNAGASHMNQAYPTRYFRQLGLVSLLDEYYRAQVSQ